MNGAAPTVVWFRNDLRLADNPALHAAVKAKQPVIPLVIWSPDEEGDWPPGAATTWWLHHSLTSLAESLATKGSRLVIRRGPALATLRSVVRETGATSVFWNRRYEPASVKRDTAIKSALREEGLAVESFASQLLFEPSNLRNKGGTPFKVYTPFWRHCLSLGSPSEPCSEPSRIPAPDEWPKSISLVELKLLPRIPWDTGFRDEWVPGQAGAKAALKRFLPGPMSHYSAERDRPDRPGTSRLSPHLHFGEISPRQVWHAADKHGAAAGPFLRQIIWREFAHHLLFHFPTTPTEPLREEFANYPWETSAALLKAWQTGQTGYPIVDAGMRQLWTTGWIHNRVRMIVGSFLVKDLLIPWQRGAEWFWDTLVDADLANNTLGWQWIAGCGADAAPFFRIFNPLLQGEKFDPEGTYVRRWVPALKNLPTRVIHNPSSATPAELRAADIELGETYPAPIVDHGTARERALEGLKEMNRRASR